MRRIVLVLVMALAFVPAAVGAQEFRTSVKRAWFVVEYQKPVMNGSPATLNVLFYGPKPSSALVEKVLRSSLDAAVAMDSSNDILAGGMSGVDERLIPTRDGSRHLLYVSKDRKTVTMKEYEGIKTAVTESIPGGYFVEYEEWKIAVRPWTKRGTVSVIFPDEPSRQKAYKILTAELKKVVAKQGKKIKTTAYAFVGERDNPAGRKQILRMSVKYDPITGKIKRR